MRVRLGPLAVFAFVALSTAYAQLGEPIESAATRYPVLPKLTLNEVPSVCGVLEREVMTRFTTPGRSLDLTLDQRFGEQRGDGWLGFDRPPPRTGLVAGGTVRVFEWDVERDGKRDLLVAFRRTRSSTYLYQLYSVPASLVEVRDAVGAETFDMFPYVPSRDVREMIEREGNEVTIAWVSPFLFVHNGELYLYQRQSLAFSPTEPNTISRLGPDGIVEACRIEFLPR
jgi:hypothetical protein